MPKVLFFLCCFSAWRAAAQCPYTAVLQGLRGSCVNDTLSVHSLHGLSKIVWYKDGAPVDSVKANQRFGDPVILTDQDFANTIPWFGIAVDDSDNIYISDYRDNSVLKWAPGATTGITVAGGNGAGSAPNQLDGPGYLFVDGNQNVYIGDVNNARVQKWAPGATSGITVAGGHGKGRNGDQFSTVSGIYVDCDGGIYAADADLLRVQYWAPGASSGTTVIDGSKVPNYLVTPEAIWLDGLKNIYVAERANGNISKWSNGGKTETIVAGVPSNNGFDNKHLVRPMGIWVDHDGDLTIADEYRISRWPAGSGSGASILNGSVSDNYGHALAVDVRGNIFAIAIVQFDEKLIEVPNILSIDTFFIPRATGDYQAVVTDISGYSVTTNTVTVKAPNRVPPSVTITATDSNLFICESATFSAVAANAGGIPSFQWEESGVPVGTNSPTYTSNVFGNGDKMYCIMTASNGCALLTDTSNKITLAVDPQGHASVAITASQDPVCAGTPIDFTATVANASANPVLDWFLNGADTHYGGSTYSNTSLADGDVVYCDIVSDASCGLGRSNSIPVVIDPLPVVDSGQVFNEPIGSSVQLDPAVSGDIALYTWSPSTGLSATDIPDPIASPAVSTVYTLTVTSPHGCVDSAHILVDVYTPLRIPGAFTPNNDGVNDVLYILGGPYGSTIDEFAVYNQWGQQVFEVHGVEPGNPSYGWNGYVRGAPAPVGTYVYFARMKFPGGQMQSYKGTVVLMR